MIEVEIDIEVEGWTEALPDVEALARQVLEATLGEGRFDPEISGTVSLLLADDAALKALNRDFRAKDQPTNVLSFPAHPSAAPHLGDLALALETCRREAAEQHKPLAHHFAHLCAHGALHLVGYDHQTEAEAEEMEALEREILAGFGVPDPYA